ncbi:MAG: VanW family protein [Clostridia bacterium]|nr:VanW family protein [Clostridia bacterium]
MQRQPSDPRRPSPRRGRRIPAKVRLALFVVLTALVVFGVVKLVGAVKEASVERFVDNVYVNGVCLTGYTQEEGTQLIYDLRDKWLNNTYALTFQDRTWGFKPSDVNAQIEFATELERAWNLGHMGDRAMRREVVKGLKTVPAEFTSDPTYDEKALDAFIDGIAAEIDTEPVEAEVTLTELKPVITRQSVNGLRLNKEALKENLIDLIEKGDAPLQLPVEEVYPTLMSENMEMRLIAKFETDMSFRGYNSRTNVRLALEHFDLMAVYPGETVSFNEVVGPRTEAFGYKKAPEYAGTNKEMGFGGGVCQASTTLYNAVIQAGMSIIQRHRHSMTVTYVNPSQDAAVAYADKDFVFRNDTEHPIFIYTNVTKETAGVRIYGTRPPYFNSLESVILHEEKSTKTGYEDDVDGKYVYYTSDPPVLYKEGRGSCESEGWIVSYDWDTKQEVSRVQVNHDIYSAGVNVYWRGVHKHSSKDT